MAMVSRAEHVVDNWPRIFPCLDGTSRRACSTLSQGFALLQGEAHRPSASPVVQPPRQRCFRFLAPGERTEHVALVSYPRSGNSLLRALLEEVTGIVTGTDTRPNRTLSRALSQFGMQGEGVLDERVWIVKTHWPERAGYEPWKARRAILLVRNPFDCFDSYFNMTLTNTHNVSLAESQYEVFADVWDRLVRHEIEIWRKFNEYWLASGVPLIAVRYEDLVREPHEVLRRVVTFVERGASGGVADDTALRAHIAAVLARAPSEELGPYKPRVGRVGASLGRFSTDQRAAVVAAAGRTLKAFGYDPKTQGFPEELRMPKEDRCMQRGTREAMVVNDTAREIELRGADDPFGRAMTRFRKSHTAGDTRPLPVKAGTPYHISGAGAVEHLGGLG